VIALSAALRRDCPETPRSPHHPHRRHRNVGSSTPGWS